jgi:hypothetical protein
LLGVEGEDEEEEGVMDTWLSLSSWSMVVCMWRVVVEYFSVERCIADFVNVVEWVGVEDREVASGRGRARIACIG